MKSACCMYMIGMGSTLLDGVLHKQNACTPEYLCFIFLLNVQCLDAANGLMTYVTNYFC